MQQLSIPMPPQGLSVEKLPSGDRVINWQSEPDVTYRIYRRNLSDTLPNGMQRKLYERVADNISGDTFTDSGAETGEKYGYIMYAVSSNGRVSPHSTEVNEFVEHIDGLSIAATATNAVLSWNTFTHSMKPVSGYTIYRRKDGEPYGHPVGYTGLDTVYTDSRLESGETYYYKVTARFDEELEIGVTNEETVTTESSTDGYYRYANLKTAVVIYQNTNRGSIADIELPKIENALNLANKFYWVNSGMKLNLEFFYYPITEYKNFPDPDDSWGSMMQTADDLHDLGVMNTQYDIVFRVTPAVNGFWSYGVQNLQLPGPERKTGFSQTTWPIGTGVIYPVSHADTKTPLIWIFVHEVQHALDALYNANGYPEMYHGDRPWEFPVACGEHFDFQAKMFRNFSAYIDLESDWGELYETADADEDGFPDDDTNLPLDENRFGSSNASGDTDGDNLSDRLEAVNGSFIGTNPQLADTDGDGIQDGDDELPLYPVNVIVPNYSPVIDGNIEEGWTMLNDDVIYSDEEYKPELYIAYDADSLYIALYLPHVGVPKFQIDFQNDGWWWGSGNTDFTITPFSGVFTEFKSWDASEPVKQYSLQNGGPGGMWDNSSAYQNQFNRRVIDPSSIHMEVSADYPEHQLEMAIPRNEYAGLTLQYGDRIALNVYYEKINNNDGKRAATFDQYGFVTFHLGGIVNGVEQDEANQPVAFALLQNYPNPFNPSTTITFELPEASAVSLNVYNILGQLVTTVAEGYFEAGSHIVEFTGSDLPSGIYFYELKTDKGFSAINKMMLLK
jgi:hypothetical protein